MSVSAQVVDGILQQKGTSSTTDTSSNKSTNSTMDKDAFLQLLVAQMKYQDPLEPTSNTEYVSQYATFSELEQMQNMSSSVDLQRATALVGQTVIVSSTSEDGKTTEDMGVVDYVSYENNKALLWVNGSSYPLDSVKEVADHDYIEAYSQAITLINAINKLPSTANLTLSDKHAVESIQKTFDDMNDYQKSFVAKDYQTKISELSEKMKELVALSELDDDKDNKTE